jgi:hypothetical protein
MVLTASMDLVPSSALLARAASLLRRRPLMGIPVVKIVNKEEKGCFNNR